MARSLSGGVCTLSEHGRNVVWRWFADPTARTAYPAGEHAYYSRLHVADLRAAVGRRSGTPVAARLVERLHGVSGGFTELWERHEVAVRRHSRMRVAHPVIGTVDLDCQVLLAPEGEQRFVLFTPPPGTDTGERLALLRGGGCGAVRGAPVAELVAGAGAGLVAVPSRAAFATARAPPTIR
ncbi:hypothetical protein ACFW2Y_05745 [Streptomyces sp. NPDC058877]|uniref:MmyB family transcriptional regulator n=1 Tax=unclassified Streptomyces TaxID=2593676 RepID=UPI00367E6246